MQLHLTGDGNHNNAWMETDMKKIYCGIALFVFFLVGFSLCLALCTDRHRGMEYSIVNSMEEFYTLLLDDTAEFAILDLRKTEDYEISHLKNSINIPYEEETFLQQLEQSGVGNIPIYLLCYSGNMSAKAFHQMAAQGIDDVHYISFGYDEYLDFLIPGHLASSMELSYQDEFPALYLEEWGETITALLQGTPYTMVAYVSNECVSCKEALADVSILNKLKDEAFQIILLWKNSMSAELLEQYQLSENSAALHGEIKLSTVTPTYFLLDEKGTIVFMEKGSCGNFISKLFEMGIFSVEKNMAATLYYLAPYMETGKRNMLFFSTENCNACAEELLKLKEDRELADINIISVYHQREALQQGENEILDRYRIFGRIFDVQGYPSIYLQSEEDGLFYPYDLD